MDSRNNYDKISSFYNLMSGPFENRYRKKAIALLSAQAGESILEIGFGTGHSLLEIGRSVGETGRIYGIDLSASMCRITGKRLEKAQLKNRTELQCGDVLKNSYKEDTFDAVFMSFTLETFTPTEIDNLLKIIRKILKPNGRYCVLSMSEEKSKSLIYKMYLWAHRHYPQFVDCRPINVEQLLINGGFSIISSESMKLYNLPVKMAVAVNQF